MLNKDLVAHLQAIAAEQRNGSLVISLGSRRVRFGFEAGELVLLDLGEEKEVSMARKLLDYHKIGPEIHRHALNTARATGASIIETLRRQQLVSEGEVELVGQAMVEDLLSLVFGLTHADLAWTDDGADTYDVEKQAVRLRIDVASLLTGVQARLEEEEAVEQAVGGFQSVYVLDEGADPSQMDEFEQHVLTMIDGRKTVENLAVAFRDSNLNMARHLVLLAQKGAIKRSAGGMSDRRAAVSSTANRDPSGVQRLPTGPASTAVAGSATAASSFEVYRPPVQRANIGARIALGAVFVVVVAIGWLVMSYGKERARIEDALAGITESVAAKNWGESRNGIAEARVKFGGDLAIVRRLDELTVTVDAGLRGELDVIRKAIAEERLDDARASLLRLPHDHGELATLRVSIAQAQKALDEHVAKLDRSVRDHLGQGEIARAFLITEGEDKIVAEKLLVTIDRWRLASIEQASLNSFPMGQRQHLLNLVMEAKPTEAQLAQINTLQAELLRYQTRRKEQLNLVQEQIKKGAYSEASETFTKNRLIDQAPGSEMEKEAKAVADELARVKTELEGIPPALIQAITESVDLKAIAKATERLRIASETYPEPSNREELTRMVTLVTGIQGVIQRADSTDAEITGLTSLAAQTTDPLLAKVITARLATLRRAQDESEGALNRAKTFLKEGNWESGFAALDRLRAASEWSRTPAARQVASVIAQAEADRSKRASLEEAFHAALTNGDVSKAFALARELGLPYLPLLVESTPPGAKVLQDGKQVGVTPLVHRVSASDRVDMVLVLKLAGYADATLKAADAIGGWRLSTDLQREPSAIVRLGEIVTNQPGLDGNTVWVANNRVLAKVKADGTFTSFGNGAESGLSQPVYAPAQRCDGALHLATRDGFVIRIDDQGAVSRLPVPVTSDHPPIVYRSQLILDRRFIILAAREGALTASDPDEPGAGWRSASGASFIAGPTLVGERVLAVRSDGNVLACQVDRGETLAQYALGEEAIAVWPVEGGIAGYTRRQAFTWDGVSAPIVTPLPREIMAGNQGVLISRDRQVLLDKDGEWRVVGSISGRVNGQPVRWGNAAVVPEGGVAEVIGEGAFRLATEAAFMNPIVANGHLILVSSDGVIRFYDSR